MLKKVVLIILLPQSFLFSQIDISRLSFDIGSVSNYMFFENRVIVPEIKLGGNLFSEYVEWEVNSSYWSEGLTDKRKGFSAHFPIFYFSSLSFGSKIYFVPSKLRFHLIFNGGFSFRNIRQKHYVPSFINESYRDKTINILSVDFGVGFRCSISKIFRIRTEINVYYPLFGSVDYHEEFGNGALKLGIDYFIK